MVQAVWFDAGRERSGRLLLTIHHLVGGRGVVADPGAGPCGGVGGDCGGREPALPARGTSFRRWAQRLALHAQETEVADELSFWRGMLSQPAPSLLRRARSILRATSPARPGI